MLRYIAVVLFCCAVASAKPSSRIYNGGNADIGQFPHQVIVYTGNDFCGGSIISSNYILTAAHCVVKSGIEPYPASFITVRAGSIQRLAGGVLHTVKKVTVRNSYGNLLDDVALLELENELVYTDNIKPIELYDGVVPVGAPVVVSGWGHVATTWEFPHRLQYTILRAMDTQTCGVVMNWGFEQIICLAHVNDNGICQGDSGGPAVYAGKLVGVATFTHKGCGNNYPDGFAKVSYHRQWILANMV